MKRPCSATVLLAVMLTDIRTWQGYQQLYQHCVNHAANITSAETLYKAAILLSKQREACDTTATYDSISQPMPQLPLPLWRIEILLYLADCYQLHPLNRRLLLLAGCCSAIVSAKQTEPLPYPALTAARELKPLPQAASVVKVLGSCYATERKQPQWQQALLSLLLTQSEYLSNQDEWQTALATRLMLSQSDYELDILHQFLLQPAAELTQQPATFAHLIQSSRFSELRYYDNKALEHYLTTSAEHSAPILALASQLNRQQQDVQSVKLAIGIIGRDALPAALAQAELQYYLSALHHPWQGVFSQFCYVFEQALQLFMPQLQYTGSRLLALCCCAPLWLDPLYQRTPLVSRSGAGYQSAFTPTLHCQSETYLPQLIELLQLYQLDNYTAAITTWLQPNAGQRLTVVSLNLQLAWLSSLALYCAAPVQPVNVLLRKTAANNQATVTAENWLQQLAQRSQCYYPLQLKL